MCVAYRLGTHRMFAGDSLPGLLTAETAENAICLCCIRTCVWQFAKNKLPATMKNDHEWQFRAGVDHFSPSRWRGQAKGAV